MDSLIQGSMKGAKHILVIGALTALFSGMPLLSQQSKPAQARTHSGNAESAVNRADFLRQLSGGLEDMVARVSPAVVQIQASGLGSVENKNGAALIVRQHAIGSGVIVDPEGYIITNAHVVEGAQRIRVVFPTPAAESPLEILPFAKQQIVDAKLIGVDKETDVAVLKVPGRNFPTAPLDRTRPVRPGELVIAIGSPQGLQSSITMGVVSSVWRQPEPDLPMVYIQTDTPINPGNSGGPLVDLEGNVIGINTFILSQGGGSEGLGFAIPASVVSFVYADLRKFGSVHRTELQISAQTITPTLVAGLGLGQSWGVIISDVAAGGLGDSSGLKVRDIVVSVDGHAILSLPGFLASLYMHRPEETLRLGVLRDSRTITFNIPASPHHDMMQQLADFIDANNRIELLGIFVIDFNDRIRETIQGMTMADGVVIVGQSPNPAPLAADVRTADIIRAVNRTPIQSVEQLKSIMHELRLGDPLVLQIERQGVLRYVTSEVE